MYFVLSLVCKQRVWIAYRVCCFFFCFLGGQEPAGWPVCWYLSSTTSPSCFRHHPCWPRQTILPLTSCASKSRCHHVAGVRRFASASISLICRWEPRWNWSLWTRVRDAEPYGWHLQWTLPVRHWTRLWIAFILTSHLRNRAECQLVTKPLTRKLAFRCCFELDPFTTHLHF